MKRRLAVFLVIAMLLTSLFAFADDALTAEQDLTIPEEEIAEEISEPEEVTEEEIIEPEDEVTEKITEPEGEVTEEITEPEEEVTEEITEPDGEVTEEETTEPDGEEAEKEITELEGEVTEEISELEGEVTEEISEPQEEGSEEAPMLLSALGATACEHKNVYVDDMRDSEHGEYYNKHFHTCRIYSETFCKDCRTVIEYVDTGKVVLCMHGLNTGSDGWYASGYCAVCGYQCPHADKAEYYDSSAWPYKNESYEPLNEKEHIWSYDADVKSVRCNDCDSLLSKASIEQTRVSKVLEHFFDDNGVCEDCGYKLKDDDCKHTHLVPPNSSYNIFTPMDENYHWCDYQLNCSESKDGDESYAYCLDCGMAIKNGVIVARGEMEHGDDYCDEHHFVNGACKECGYVQQAQPTCDHTQYGYNSVIDESIVPKYVNVTETTHCVQHTVKLYCKNCGEYVKSVLEEGIEPIPHTFIGGICECGYQEAVKNPYVVGFTMSASKIKAGDTVTFTLNFANVNEGDPLTVEFCADDWKTTFDLTAPANTFSKDITTAGDRKIKFRVCGENGVWSEYCAVQTLTVESVEAKIESAKAGISLDKTYVERADGIAFTVTVVTNSNANVAELYVGDHGDTIDDYYKTATPSYTDESGRNVFTFQFYKGGNGKSYAGEYKVVVNVLKGQYQSVEDSKTLGTLKIEHDMQWTSPYNSFYRYERHDAETHKALLKQKLVGSCIVCGYSAEKEETINTSYENHTGEDECDKCGYTSKNVIYSSAENAKNDLVNTSKNLKWGEKGKIRYAQQRFTKSGSTNRMFFEEYWKGIESKTGLCNWATFSMAYSYLGDDYLPYELREKCMNGNTGDNFNQAKKLGYHVENNKKKYSDFIEMFDNYANDPNYIYSPVIVYLTDKRRPDPEDDGHWVLVIGRDEIDENLYYIANAGTNNVVDRIVLYCDEDGNCRSGDIYNGDGKVSKSNNYKDLVVKGIGQISKIV